MESSTPSHREPARMLKALHDIGLRETTIEDVRAAIREVNTQSWRDVLDRIDVATKVCTEHGDPPGLFGLLLPPMCLRGMHPKLYQSHAEALGARFVAGDDTRLATNAEVLVAMMNASLKAPLNTPGLALYEYLFEDIFGSLPSGSCANELYPGHLQEILAEARHKLRVVGRVCG